jgi:hypothetical protein
MFENHRILKHFNGQLARAFAVIAVSVCLALSMED